MLQRMMVLYYFFLLIPGVALTQLQPIGHWRDHLPYHQVIAVVPTDNKIWAATPYSLFSVDEADNNIDRWSKIDGLSETGISAISIDNDGKKIIIAYSSSNIDILSGSDIININAVKNASLPGDKKIYSIFTRNQLAYLCTGFGIVVIDLVKYEVKDTYIIGHDGANSLVYNLVENNNFFYAATAEGLKQAPATGINLADYRNWTLVSGAPGLSAGAVQAVSVVQNNVLALKNDSLFVSSGNNWNLLYEDGRQIKNLTVSNGKILLSEAGNNAGRIVSLTPAGLAENIIQDQVFTASPSQAVYFKNNFWVADSLAGLSKYTGSAFISYIPNSPASIATGELVVMNNTLWAAAGGVTATWQPAGNKNGIYRFNNDVWTTFNATSLTQLDSFPDFISLATDPTNESIWAGSFGGGLVNIMPDHTVSIYKQNTPLQPAAFTANSYRVSGLAFDIENNLWIANYGASQNLHVKKADGNWQSFTVPFPLPENGVSQIIIDDVNQKWIVAPMAGGLVSFNHGQTIENTGDDQWKWFRAGTGNGNLPDNNVLCIAKDRNNFIWVGTTKGIGIIQCPQDITCEAVLPIVQQDNFAGYLFRDEQVQTIAVDGADRKWIGTLNGVWLISADAEKTIYRFTEDNSPLLSNDVKKITVNGITGEVFFATAKGICSYRAAATEGATVNNDVLVFPNPVPPGYNGTIAIRGVANNAIVKITETNGRLVYQTRALGGQAIWNGKDYRGRSISTGVYLVLVSDDNRRENLVTKIVFIKQ